MNLLNIVLNSFMNKNINIFIILIIIWIPFYFVGVYFIWLKLIVWFSLVHIALSLFYLFKWNKIFILSAWALLLIHAMIALYDFPLCDFRWKSEKFNSCNCAWIKKQTIFKDYCIWKRTNCFEYKLNNETWIKEKIKIECNALKDIY